MSIVGNSEWARPEPKRKKRLDPADWAPSYEGPAAKSAAEEAADQLDPDGEIRRAKLAAKYEGARSAFFEDAYLPSNADGTKQGRR